MTAFIKTITCSVNIFGVSPSDKWNQYNWAAFKWGEGTNDTAVYVNHVLGNTLTLDSALTKAPGIHLRAQTLSVGVDMSSEGVRDTHGYSRVFPDRTTQGESRTFTTWATPASASVSWSQATPTTTTWS